MSIVTIILTLLVIGFVIYIIQTAPIPIHPWFKMIIMGVIGICALIFVLNLLGVHTGIPLRLW